MERNTLAAVSSYLNRASLDSQISFCFTVFQEKSSRSNTVDAIRVVAPQRFSHAQSLLSPCTKRMQ